jgi:hypothetical protein
MEDTAILDPSEKEEKSEPSGATSAGRISRKKEKVSIDRPAWLQLITHALYEYQKSGGDVQGAYETEDGHLAIVLGGVALAEDGTLIEIPPAPQPAGQE